MTSSSYVIMPKNEFEFRKSEIVLTAENVEELIEHKDVFVKFLNKSIHKVQSDLWSLEYIWKESVAVIEITTIREVIKSMDTLIEMYKKHIEELEK